MDEHVFAAFKTLLFELVGGEGDALRAGLVVGIGLLAASGVMGWVATKMSDGSVSFRSALLATLLDAVVLLGVVIVTREFICPHVGAVNPRWVVWGAVALVFFAILLPMNGKLLSVAFSVALTALVAAAVALVLFAYLTALGYDTILRGNKNISARRSSRQAQEKVLY